jgi:hypothetical protein
LKLRKAPGGVGIEAGKSRLLARAKTNFASKTTARFVAARDAVAAAPFP